MLLLRAERKRTLLLKHRISLCVRIEGQIECRPSSQMPPTSWLAQAEPSRRSIPKSLEGAQQRTQQGPERNQAVVRTCGGVWPYPAYR